MNIPAGLRPHFKALTVLGALLIVGDVWLSGRFGYTLGLDLMFIVAAISLASGILPVVCVMFHRAGYRKLAGLIAGAWFAAFVFNCFSNMGVSTANRMADVQRATVQQTNYSEQKETVAEAKRSLELFQGQLATLIKQNEWAGTVTADGLRAQVADLRKAEAAESRLGGCGQKCRGIQNQIAELQGRIATAEQRADLTKRIEATKTVIAKHRTTLAETDKGISNAANQSKLYAKLIGWNLVADPDMGTITAANETTGIATAIVLALIAAAVTLAGAWPHLMTVNSSLLDEFHKLPDTNPNVGEPVGNRNPAPRAYHPPRLETATIAQLRQMAA
jgi:hypothetical protein